MTEVEILRRPTGGEGWQRRTSMASREGDRRPEQRSPKKEGARLGSAPFL